MKKTIEAIKSMLNKYNNQIFTAGICMYVFAIIMSDILSWEITYQSSYFRV